MIDWYTQFWGEMKEYKRKRMDFFPIVLLFDSRQFGANKNVPVAVELACRL